MYSKADDDDCEFQLSKMVKPVCFLNDLVPFVRHEICSVGQDKHLFLIKQNYREKVTKINIGIKDKYSFMKLFAPGKHTTLLSY